MLREKSKKKFDKSQVRFSDSFIFSLNRSPFSKPLCYFLFFSLYLSHVLRISHTSLGGSKDTLEDREENRRSVQFLDNTLRQRGYKS